MDPRNKEFLKLKATWYKKLRKSGFDDIEQDEDRLKNLVSNTFRGRFSAAKYEGQLEYYRLAGQFLYDFPFENNRQRTVWQLHSEGHTHPAISAIMAKRSMKIHRNEVSEIVRALAKEMLKDVNRKKPTDSN